MNPPMSQPAGPPAAQQRTRIYRRTADGAEFPVGYLEAGVICRLRGGASQPAGRVDAEGRVYRRTAHDERELGFVTAAGRVHSHGLFTGGELGWIDPDGVVVQAGLILGEEEVGSVQGPDLNAAGAALLLLFLPDLAEEERSAAR